MGWPLGLQRRRSLWAFASAPQTVDAPLDAPQTTSAAELLVVVAKPTSCLVDSLFGAVITLSLNL